MIRTSETVFEGSDKLLKLHLVHGRDDVLAMDGLPALVVSHGVGLRCGVQDKHTGGLDIQIDIVDVCSLMFKTFIIINNDGDNE